MNNNFQSSFSQASFMNNNAQLYGFEQQLPSYAWVSSTDQQQQQEPHQQTPQPQQQQQHQQTPQQQLTLPTQSTQSAQQVQQQHQPPPQQQTSVGTLPASGSASTFGNSAQETPFSAAQYDTANSIGNSVEPSAQNATSTPRLLAGLNAGVGGSPASQLKNPRENDYLQRCAQAILEVNKELIRICIEYQENNLVNEKEFPIYKSRLQSNLHFLATVADQPSNPQMESKAKMTPEFGPLPVPRNGSQVINDQLKRAEVAFQTYLQVQKLSSAVLGAAGSNGNGSRGIATNTLSAIPASTITSNDTVGTVPSQQFKLAMGQGANNQQAAMFNAALFSKQQQQQTQQFLRPQQAQQQMRRQQSKASTPTQLQSQSQLMQHSLQQATPQQPQPARQQQPSQAIPQQQQIKDKSTPTQQQQQQTQQQQLPSTVLSTMQSSLGGTYAQQNLLNQMIPDYSLAGMTTDNSSYQVLPPLVGLSGMANPFVSTGTNGSATAQMQPVGLPSLMGVNDPFQGMPAQQLQQLSMGFGGYMNAASGGLAGAGATSSSNGVNYVSPAGLYGMLMSRAAMPNPGVVNIANGEGRAADGYTDDGGGLIVVDGMALNSTNHVFPSAGNNGLTGNHGLGGTLPGMMNQDGSGM